MKRINAATNAPFKFGDIGHNGSVFTGYVTNRPVKKDGFFGERWISADKYPAFSEKKQQRERNHPQSKETRLKQISRHAKTSAKKRNQQCSITEADVLALWDRQNGLCAYTGWEMIFISKTDRLVSIERIDNNIGYTPDNIILVCWCVNRARGGMTQSGFFEMCKAVTNRML